MSCLTNWDSTFRWLSMNKIQCQLAERVLSVCKISRNLDKNHPEFKHKWYRSCSGAKTLPWHVTGATTLSVKTISIKGLFGTFGLTSLGIITSHHYAKWYYGDCRVLFIGVLHGIMLSIVMLSVMVQCQDSPRWVQSVKLSIVVNLVSDVEHCWLSCTWYKQY